jgi:hypothetical protein
MRFGDGVRAWCSYLSTGLPLLNNSSSGGIRRIELGYTNVRAYEEGLDGWKPARHSVETLQEPAPAI